MYGAVCSYACVFQIVIATPGRLCELAFDRRKIKLGGVSTIVLDEIDALLRPPYDQEIDAIVDATPAGAKLTPLL